MVQISTKPSEKEERPLFFDPDAVMSLTQWYARNGISKATGLRIIARGEGPEIIALSPNRKGVTYGADAAWKAKRRILPAT
jgi:hypothetical protein